MNIKKKNFIFCLIGMFVFATLLSCGIFALADSVKFKLGITLKPSIYFALSLKIDNGEEQWIFDNRPTNANKVVTWANVKNLTISLENDDISTAESLELRVYNYNADKYMSFEVYDTAGGVLSLENNGLKNIDTNQAGILNLKMDAVVNGVYQFKVQAEIYDEAIKKYDVYVNNSKSSIVYENQPFTYSFNIDYMYTMSIDEIYIGFDKFTDYQLSNSNILSIAGTYITNNIYIYYSTDLSVWGGGVATCFQIGDGSQENPFQIATGEELALMSTLVNNANAENYYADSIELNSITTTVNQRCNTNYAFGTAHYALKNDLILNRNYEEYSTWDINSTELNEFIPAGSDALYFAGVFNGNYHKINGLYIKESYFSTGLFGGASGTIKNLGVQSSKVLAWQTNNALICGYLSSSGYIINCFNSGDLYVNASTSYPDSAGISGKCFGKVIECWNEGTIFSETNASEYSGSTAGLIGCAYGDVKNCYNIGKVTATYTTGGITGIYSIGSTTSTRLMTNCYNIGVITGPSIGAITYSSNGKNATIEYSHWLYDTTVSPALGMAKGITVNSSYNAINYCTALTKSQFQTINSVETNFPNWDFDTVWDIDPNINNGYPYLQCYLKFL